MRNITNLESQILYKKYRKEGLDQESANKRIDNIRTHLRTIVLKLKAKNKSKEEINEKFKLEFYKLVEQTQTQEVEK